MGKIQPESGSGSDQDVAPTTPDSQTPSDKPISRLDEGARAEVSQIVSKAVQKAFSGVQSGKDRDVADARKAAKDAQSVVLQLRNTLEAKGYLTKEIEAVLNEEANEGRLERLESKFDSLLEKGIGSPSQEAPIVYDEAFIAAGYKPIEVTAEDQTWAITEVEQGKIKTQADLKNALFKRRASQQATKPTPDGSGIVSPSGGGVGPEPGVKAVTDEYAEKYAKAANEGASQDELTRITAAYKAKGAAVEGVRFTYKTGGKPR